MSDYENDFQNENNSQEKEDMKMNENSFESTFEASETHQSTDAFTDKAFEDSQDDFESASSDAQSDEPETTETEPFDDTPDYRNFQQDPPLNPYAQSFGDQNNSQAQNPQQQNAYSNSYNSQNYQSADNQQTNPYSQNYSYNYAPNNGNNAQPINNTPPTSQYPPYGNHFNQPTPPPKKKKGNGKVVAAVIVVAALVIAVVAIICGVAAGRNPNKNKSELSDATSAFVTESTAPADDSTQPTSDNASVKVTNSSSELSAVEIAEKVRPSVVGVMTYSGGQLDGEGSGVIMGEDSTKKYTYIITCAHVISDKGVTFGVMTIDGTTYEATRIAYDEKTDIGVLKIEATGLTTAEFGDSSALKVGETVYAIGNPGGSEYFGSMTDGIISAIDRSVNSTYAMTCIQHNAAINPGNSGGALVNSAGQVIGINSSKIAATDYEGMGFAIPMSIAKSIVDNLIQYGYVPNRPKLGIQYQSLSSNQLYSMVAQIKGLPQGSLIIASISDDSAFAGTSAQVGDIITAVNGVDMDKANTLLDLVDAGAVGDTLKITLCRIENNTYKTSTFDVNIQLVEDKGANDEESTTAQSNNNGASDSFSDFFSQYFGNDFGF